MIIFQVFYSTDYNGIDFILYGIKKSVILFMRVSRFKNMIFNTIHDKNLKVPVKMWVKNPEEGVIRQARDIASLSCAFSHVALMPDAHEGFGMPIGGVLALKDVIIPNAVGVDIGCGMSSYKSTIKEIDRKTLIKIVDDIKKKIPLGFKHHSKKISWEGFQKAPDIAIIDRELDNACFQLGTLGGGNHFIEIQKGSDSHIHVMIHSGSRNFGYKIAGEYHNKAKKVCSEKNYSVPVKDLSWLYIDSKEGREYYTAMNYALDFAYENRKKMMDVITEIFTNYIAGLFFTESVNIHHNYASVEKHFGEEVVVHRKGAIFAGKGTTGIIPGSQGSKSYIVEGKGCPESFLSCSHGAGRKMGRKEAVSRLDLKEEKAKLDKLGIIHSLFSRKDLDEACSAYKDIDDVMQMQDDLVKINIELIPLAVIKG